jgi:hypothetical protein
VNEHEMRDAYEAALRKGEQRHASVDLPVDRIGALVGREGSEAERLRALDVLMSSAEGRREFEVAWAAARAGKEHEQRMARARSSRTRLFAAAALLIISAGTGTVWMSRRTAATGPEAQRGSESPLPLVTPRYGEVPQQSAHFVWRGVATAREYTLVVVDSTGAEVFARETRDTSVTLPDSIRLRAGAQYLWWVQAAMPDGSTLSAVTARIRATK